MSTVAPVSAPTAATPAPAGANDRAALAKAAKQFEAIFVRRMFAAARETHFDEGGLFSSQAMGTFRQMQDERFADIASDRGAFGLARMIETHLARQMPQAKEPG